MLRRWVPIDDSVPGNAVPVIKIMLSRDGRPRGNTDTNSKNLYIRIDKVLIPQ